MDVKRINDFVRNLDSAINITGITVYGVDDEGHSVKVDTEMLTNPKPTFTEASTRTNLVGNGESTTTMWGKVKKFFTDLKTVAFSGSYNDIDNKPLSVENSKVKYTLSDGATKLTLVQYSELKAVAFSGSYNDLTDKLQNATTTTAGLMSANDKTLVNNLSAVTILSISISDYYCCLLADITEFWESPSTTVNLAGYGFCGLVIRFRNGGNLNSNCANMVAMVSYKNDGADDHQRFISSDSNFVPHIVKYANKYYISLDFGRVNAHTLIMIGKFHNCLSPFQIVLQSDCTVIV